MSLEDDAEPVITATPNGPFVVTGGVPAYRRRVIESEHGEPMTWETTDVLPTGDAYALCRCGNSAEKPFCDGAHATTGFVADDVASGTIAERSKVLGGTGVTVSDDRSICVHAGFCGSRVTNIWKQVGSTDESVIRAQVINFVERCPSGALTYAIEGRTLEPLLPVAVAVTEDGPLWVTGGVDVVTSNGDVLERRNRVTLCRCGASANKPLCDGKHKTAGFRDPTPAE